MELGLAGNGRAGNWYVEAEEELETEKLTLIIQHPNVKDEVRIPLRDDSEEINSLIDALVQLKADLGLP